MYTRYLPEGLASSAWAEAGRLVNIVSTTAEAATIKRSMRHLDGSKIEDNARTQFLAERGEGSLRAAPTGRGAEPLPQQTAAQSRLRPTSLLLLGGGLNVRPEKLFPAASFGCCLHLAAGAPAIRIQDRCAPQSPAANPGGERKGHYLKELCQRPAPGPAGSPAR